MGRRTNATLAVLAGMLISGLAGAEVVYLTNGDTIHGTLTAANNESVTLQTPYGELIIPKDDIARIDYDNGDGDPETLAPTTAAAPSSARAPASETTASGPDLPGARGLLTLQITGRSFWYAFDSKPDDPADTSIRLRLYVGSAPACLFLDEKPDTVDGTVLYNSFTFSPTDSRVVESLEGYECRVEKTDAGEVEVAVGLPGDAASGRQLVRMLYEVNEGTQRFPRWREAVSRSFPVELAPGKESSVLLEQNADALEYTGFFKKQMKNLEQFQLTVLSTELQG